MGFEYDDNLDAGYGAEDNQQENNNPTEGAKGEGNQENPQSQEGNNQEGSEGQEGQEGGGQDGDEGEGKQSLVEQIKKKAEETKLKVKLAMMIVSLIMSGRYALKPNENEDFRKAKKHENLKPMINKINAIMAANFTKQTLQTIPKFLPVAKYLLVAFILLIFICALVGTFANVFGENGGNVGAMIGVTGKDFYGIRMVYENEEQANNELIGEYLTIIEDSVESVPATYTVNIEFPSDDYKIDYNTFPQEYGSLSSVVFNVAKVVSKIDNGAESAAGDLVTVLSEVKYFGIPQAGVNDISTVISDFIKTNTTDNEGNAVTSDFSQNVQACLQNKLIRTEKLLIKDYIFTSDNQMQANVSKEKYVAFIFMPKRDITFTAMGFVVQGPQVSDVELKLTNNGSEIRLTRDDSDYNKEDGSIQREIYECKQNVSASVYQNIDTNNLGALSEGVGLCDIMNIEGVNKDAYLTVSQENSEVYTYRQDGVVLTISFKTENPDRGPFTVSESITKWI